MSKIGTRTYDLLLELLKDHPSNVETLARRVGINKREIYRELQDLRDRGVKFEEGLKRGMYQISRESEIFRVVLKREVRSEPVSLDPETTDRKTSTSHYAEDNQETIKLTKHGEEIFAKVFEKDAPAMTEKFVSKCVALGPKYYSAIRSHGFLIFGGSKSEKFEEKSESEKFEKNSVPTFVAVCRSEEDVKKMKELLFKAHCLNN